MTYKCEDKWVHNVNGHIAKSEILMSLFPTHGYVAQPLVYSCWIQSNNADGWAEQERNLHWLKQHDIRISRMKLGALVTTFETKHLTILEKHFKSSIAPMHKKRMWWIVQRQVILCMVIAYWIPIRLITFIWYTQDECESRQWICVVWRKSESFCSRRLTRLSVIRDSKCDKFQRVSLNTHIRTMLDIQHYVAPSSLPDTKTPMGLEYVLKGNSLRSS